VNQHSSLWETGGKNTPSAPQAILSGPSTYTATPQSTHSFFFLLQGCLNFFYNEIGDGAFCGDTTVGHWTRSRAESEGRNNAEDPKVLLCSQPSLIIACNECCNIGICEINGGSSTKADVAVWVERMHHSWPSVCIWKGNLRGNVMGTKRWDGFSLPADLAYPAGMRPARQEWA
jgi:hypothetical protein